MTTIAACVRARVMVADSRVTDGELKWHVANKIERIGDVLFGAAGDCADIELFYRWLRDRKKRPPKLNGDFCALELSNDGLFMWDSRMQPFKVGRDYHAIGSGAKAALAAFLMGADAPWAVEIACKVDSDSEPPIHSFPLDAKASA